MDNIGVACDTMDYSNVKQVFKQYGGATPTFSLNGIKALARVVDVYDGDTVTLVLEVNGAFLKFKTRLMGIDACEMKSKTSQSKELAVKARNKLFDLVTGQKHDVPVVNKKDIAILLEKEVYLVWVHCSNFDKYGRLLAEIFASPKSTKSFSSIIIQESLAYKYEGDTKLTEEQQVKLLGR